MNALVTGGKGFIGSNLVKKLSEQNNAVIIQSGYSCVSGVDWNRHGLNLDALFHLSANNDTLDLDRDNMFRTNVEESKELFNKCLDNGCRQFVFASSTAVYGDQPAPHCELTPIKPLNPYAESKAVFEEWVAAWAKKHNVNCVCLRYCNVYGPGEEHKGRRASMIYQLFLQMMAGKRPRLFRDGEQKRDWIWVGDVVQANLLASRFQGVETFNCGVGSPVTFNNLVAMINGVMGATTLEPEYIDNPSESMYQAHTECSMLRAKELLGFKPGISIEEGIKAYWSYLRSVSGQQLHY